jgi:ribonuclease P protein component
MASGRYTFTRSQRLKEQLVFVRATRKGDRESRGPLIFHALSSPLLKGRLGIRIGRRCGTAPRRNRVKRMLRESYRLMQHDWPLAIDLVITVKPHEPLPLAEYQRMMSHVMMKLCKKLLSTPTGPA